MLVTEKNSSISNFIDVFKKKFSNFASKAPVLISFEVDLEGVLVREQGTGKSLKFIFDHSKTVKQNIKMIKDWLVENTYPVMIQEKKGYVGYSIEELEKIINDSGIEPEQASLMKREVITLVKHRIMKIIVKKDELFVENLNTGKQFRFRMTMPSTILLRRMRDSWTPRYAYEIFSKKSQLLNEIYKNNEEDSLDEESKG